MLNMATIHCQDCGAARERCPSNTRYCRACRLLRDIDYWHHRVRNCPTCEAVYAPLSRTDAHCSSCDPGLVTRHVDCVICRSNGHPAVTGIPVCAVCLRDPAQRHLLWLALRKGQSNRAQANSQVTP